MKPIQKRFRAALCVLMCTCLSAFAVIQEVHFDLVELIQIDSGNSNGNYSTASTARVVLNGSDGSEARAVFRLAEALLDYDVERLPKVELTLQFFNNNANTNVTGGRELILAPLTTDYDPETVTWLQASGETPWDGADGFYMTNQVISELTYGPGNYSKAVWDITPLVKNSNTWAALKEYGGIIRMDDENWPVSTDNPNMPRAPFVTPRDTSNLDERPDVYAVLLDPFEDTHLFAVSYIDSRAVDQDTVFWEQGSSTVGKVLLNYDLSECRAIISMPEDLVAADPDRIQSVVAKFDAQIDAWSGERIFLYPITTATDLVRRPNDLADLPTHGPTWLQADGPVDTAEEGEWTNWNTPGGDWATQYEVEGTVAIVSGYDGTATFDLTKLWKNPTARNLLIDNGAIVVMDPTEWPNVLEKKIMPRVNLYRPDEYVQIARGKYSYMRVTEYAAADEGAILTAYMDSASEDENFSSGATMRTLLNSDGSECRTLLHFPEGFLDVDTKQVGEVNLFMVLTGRAPGADYQIALHPVTTPFVTTELTWNQASAELPWTTPGGDFLPAYVQGNINTNEGFVQFSLSGLLMNADYAAPLVENGALLRMLGDRPESSSLMVNTIGSSGNTPADRPAAMIVPAELEIRSMSMSGNAFTIDVMGVSPLHTYVIRACSDIVAASDDPSLWETVATLPKDGVYSIPIDVEAGTAFYQIKQLD